MEGNEGKEDEKHETGSSTENVELSSSIEANNGHTQDNVISKKPDNQLCC